MREKNVSFNLATYQARLTAEKAKDVGSTLHEYLSRRHELSSHGKDHMGVDGCDVSLSLSNQQVHPITRSCNKFAST